jgi:uncharacterized protein YhaN
LPETSDRSREAKPFTRPTTAHFFLLDDPFTDMDATRRAAIQSIGTFAENHQVLFFTCHPDHAEELQNRAYAKSLEVAE